MIVLSCGHEVFDFDHAYDIMVKETSRKGEKAIGYMTVCGLCLDQYQEVDHVFNTEEQANEWLKKEEW